MTNPAPLTSITGDEESPSVTDGLLEPQEVGGSETSWPTWVTGRLEQRLNELTTTAITRRKTANGEPSESNTETEGPTLGLLTTGKR